MLKKEKREIKPNFGSNKIKYTTKNLPSSLKFVLALQCIISSFLLFIVDLKMFFPGEDESEF